jgi:hypothetical protein
VRTGSLGAGCTDPLVEAGAADVLAVVADAAELDVPADDVRAGAVTREPVPDLMDEHAVRAASIATTATMR